MESRSNDDLLFTQPDDILKEIGKSPAAIINLSNSSQRFHTLFSQTLELPLALERLRQLLNHAALGEWTDAECIWKRFPDLLTCRGTVFFPNRTYITGQAPVNIPADQHPGRYKYVNCTALEMAFMNEEWEIAGEMAEYMNEEEKQKQLTKVFPDGEIKCYRLNLEIAKKLLEAVFNAVINDTTINKDDLNIMEQSTRDKLDALYAYVGQAPEHKTGLVFDTHIYIEALRLYENKYGQFKDWQQKSFWCIRIEEHLASLLGTGYLRHHAQGMMNQVRSTGCTLTDNTSIHPFRRDSNSIPGLHFFVGKYGWLRRGGGWEGYRAGFFQNLCQAKTKAGAEFARQYFRENTSVYL